MSLRIPTLLGKHEQDDHVTFDESEPRTARDLADLAEGVAEALGPVTDTDEVLVVCQDMFLFAGAMLGAWRAGYRVGLPPNSQPKTVASVRQQTSVKTVLHDHDEVRGIDLRTVGGCSADSVHFVPVSADQNLVSVYTSGSTGDHRRCPKTARQLLGEAGLLVDSFPDLARARVLSMVPAHHIYGLLFGVLVPLVSGGAFRRTPARGIWEVLECGQRGADVLVSVPALLGAFRTTTEGGGFTRVFSSGAPLHAAAAAALSRNLGWNVTEVLGSTETGGIAYRMLGADPAPPYVAFQGIGVQESEDGRMLLRSPLIDEEVFTSEDVIHANEDGSFVHLGRADGVIKIGSTRVSVAEVERHLLSIEGIRDAAVFAQSTERNRGTELWAVLETERTDETAIRLALSQWLSPIVIPRRFRFVDKLPRTDRGKVRRAEILELFEPVGRGT